MSGQHVQIVLPMFPRSTYEYPVDQVHPVDYEVGEPPC